MSGSVDRVSVTLRIAATARQIFLAVTDPACHVEIDGSGMLRSGAGGHRLEAVGDTFDIEMDRPAVAGRAASGRVYGWEIEPVGDTACDVTNYCDWHAISDELRAMYRWPVVSVPMLKRSTENLARIATGQTQLDCGTRRPNSLHHHYQGLPCFFYRDALPLSRKSLDFATGIIRRQRKSVGSRWRKLNPAAGAPGAGLPAQRRDVRRARGRVRDRDQRQPGDT